MNNAVVAIARTAQVNKTVQYECEDCEIIFCLLDHLVVCPSCGSKDLRRLVIVYKENDSELDQMYSESDWSAGD